MRDNPPAIHKLSLRKRLLLWAISAALLIVFTECSAFVATSLSQRHWFSWAELQARRAAVERPDDSFEFTVQSAPQVLHPYVGYVLDPSNRTDQVSPLGYPDTRLAIQKREPGKCVLAIMGGSVAASFFYNGAPELIRQLRQSPQFSGKEFTAVNLAMGGYKQPQQLMTLNYLLALGAEFDIVVNIDGFNEVALHESENAGEGVFPIYPRRWASRCGGLPNETQLRAIGRREDLRQRRQQLARRFSSLPWRYSVTCNLIWTWRDQSSARALQQAERDISTSASTATRYVETGPQLQLDGGIYQHLVAIWSRSSLQLHRLCQANTIQYFHFLQPNQYFAGTKPLNPQERAQAFDENHPYKAGVEKGYPLLVGEGRHLAAQGVHFHDLTNIFAGSEETIYKDTCCHVNQHGNDILASHIGRAILDDLHEASVRQNGQGTTR